MTGWTKPALGLAIAIVLAGQAFGQGDDRPGTKQPYEIIRSLQAIQDQIVRGNASARTKVPRLIEQMSERLLSASPDVWRDPKNACAAIIYTLSGGPTQVIRKVIETGVSPEPELELMRGSLAYSEGREEDAKKILSKIDAKTVNPAAAGHVAMIQSSLAAKENPAEAMRLLDLARVLAPGTLVEETALRRELVLADAMGDIQKFAFLSSEYIWRFRSSAYFESFRQRFASSATHFALTIQPAQFPAFEELLGEVELPGQLGLYLQIAQKAIIDGKPSAARFAAGKAVQLSAEGSVERARSKLYEAAALILTDQFEKGAGELDTVDAPRLPKPDAELKEAVASLAKLIGDGSANPQEPATPDPRPQDQQDHKDHSASGETSAAASATALIDLAQQKLGQTDELLEGKTP
jgi:chemotaxis protein MotC